METVVVTISCPPDEPFDVQLPLVMTPAQIVDELVAQHLPALSRSPLFRPTATAKPDFSVRLAGRVLPAGQPLAEAGLLDGDILELSAGPPMAEMARDCPPVAVSWPTLQALATCELFTCRQAQNAIGRDKGDIALGRLPDGAKVSARHARLFQKGGQWWIEDLGSTNGTLLNGQLLPARRPAQLRHGTQLRLGGATGPALVFLMPANGR